MRACSRCILPETYPGIVFGEDGVCNYCRSHRQRSVKGEQEFREIIDSYRDPGRKYDCIVALSGGRDSTYMLYFAKKQLDLRVLACFVDNGYVPEQTMKNIRSATGILGIDLVIKKHEYVRACARHTLRSWIRKPAPGMIGLMCAGCNYALRYHLLEAAKENRIPLMLFGLGEPEPETTFAEKLLMRNPNRRLSKVSLAGGFASQIASNPRYLVNPKVLSIYAKEYAFRWVPFLRKLMTRKIAYGEYKVLAPFYYVEWDEAKIMSVIAEKLHWEKCSYSGSSWRADCEIATFKNYLYREMMGFSKQEEILSGMIRCGMTTREEAQERLARESVISEEFIRDFLVKLDLDFDDLQASLRRYAERRVG